MYSRLSCRSQCEVLVLHCFRLTIQVQLYLPSLVLLIPRHNRGRSTIVLRFTVDATQNTSRAHGKAIRVNVSVIPGVFSFTNFSSLFFSRHLSVLFTSLSSLQLRGRRIFFGFRRRTATLLLRRFARLSCRSQCKVYVLHCFQLTIQVQLYLPSIVLLIPLHNRSISTIVLGFTVDACQNTSRAHGKAIRVNVSVIPGVFSFTTFSSLFFSRHLSVLFTSLSSLQLRGCRILFGFRRRSSSISLWFF